MRVLIVENEKTAALRLQHLLVDCEEPVEIAGVLDSIKDTVSFFQQDKPVDLAFMDIHLEDGLSFDIFNQLEVKTPIVFTTAHEEYALNAFKVHSIDYLLKPIMLPDLQQAIDKYKQLLHYLHPPKQVIDDVRNALLAPFYKNRFVVKIGDHLRSIVTENIVCFFSDAKMTFLVTKDERSYIIDFSLEQLEACLHPDKFFRINRSHIVNIHYIEDILQHESNRLLLTMKHTKKEEIFVSRERVSAFKVWLGQ